MIQHYAYYCCCHFSELFPNTIALTLYLPSTEAVPVYFNEVEVMGEGVGNRNVTSGCEYEGGEKFCIHGLCGLHGF